MFTFSAIILSLLIVSRFVVAAGKSDGDNAVLALTSLLFIGEGYLLYNLFQHYQ